MDIPPNFHTIPDRLVVAAYELQQKLFLHVLHPENLGLEGVTESRVQIRVLRLLFQLFVLVFPLVIRLIGAESLLFRFNMVHVKVHRGGLPARHGHGGDGTVGDQGSGDLNRIPRETTPRVLLGENTVYRPGDLSNWNFIRKLLNFDFLIFAKFRLFKNRLGIQPRGLVCDTTQGFTLLLGRISIPLDVLEDSVAAQITLKHLDLYLGLHVTAPGDYPVELYQLPNGLGLDLPEGLFNDNFFPEVVVHLVDVQVLEIDHELIAHFLRNQVEVRVLLVGF